jgi:hypothetical protein
VSRIVEDLIQRLRKWERTTAIEQRRTLSEGATLSTPMPRTISAFIFLSGICAIADNLTPEAAGRFAKLALACIQREYPNKIAHVLNSDADAKAPRDLTPAFYGCFDWHSSVHGHWLLARLARTFPDAVFTDRAKAALEQNFTTANLKRDAEYVAVQGRECAASRTGSRSSRIQCAAASTATPPSPSD